MQASALLFVCAGLKLLATAPALAEMHAPGRSETCTWLRSKLRDLCPHITLTPAD